MKLAAVIIIGLLLLAAALYGGYFYASQKADIMEIKFINDSNHKVFAGYRMELAFGEKRSFEIEVEKHSHWVHKMTRNGEGEIIYYVKDGSGTKKVPEYITSGYPVGFFSTPGYVLRYTGSTLRGEFTK